jgi:hypothetical protein
MTERVGSGNGTPALGKMFQQPSLFGLNGPIPPAEADYCAVPETAARLN